MTARGLRGALAVGLGLGLVLAAAESGAFWTATTTPGSAGAASATTMPDGPVARVAVRDRDDVRVDWDAVTLPDGTSVDGYALRRTDATGRSVDATGGCAEPVRATGCTEADVADGVWTYRVVARLARWSGEAGDPSAAVRTDATAPAGDLDLRGGDGGSARSGATYWYRGAAAGSFRVLDPLTDPGGSGPAASTSEPTDAAGWTHEPARVTTPDGGPYLSAPYRWAAGTTSEWDLGVVGEDVAGNTVRRTVRVRPDDEAPLGGEVVHPDGATTATRADVAVSPAYDDRSGVATRVLQGATAPLSGNTCGDFGAWTDLATEPGATVGYDTPVGRCHRVRHVLTDRVGNVRTVDGAGVSKVRDYAATITATAGLTSYWRLGERGGPVMTAVRGGPGLYVGGPEAGRSGAIAGDPDTAVAFDGFDDQARVARPVADSFSIELWFRATSGRGGSGSWTNGAPLVDATAPTFLGESGFGVSLFADGRVVGGVANGLFAPARTVVSAPGHADGGWHHVVLTRDRGSGRLELYVDGELVSVATGTTAALGSAPDLVLGRLQAGSASYLGDLDEVATYARVLPAATVLDHYRSGLP